MEKGFFATPLSLIVLAKVAIMDVLILIWKSAGQER